MKTLTKISSVALIAISAISCNTQKESSELTNLRDSASYVIGYDFGSQVAQFPQILPDSVNLEALISGLREAALNVTDEPTMSMEDMQRVIETYQTEQLEKKFKPEIEAGKQFLEENAKREGVKTSASGLQYEVITMGKGATPGQFDEVVVHYHGTKLDGTVFDSSKGSEPITFNVGQVVPGFSEGLQLFPAGSKFKLFIPQELAYSMQPPRGSSLKPFETLIFEVELISFKKGEAPQHPQFDMSQFQMQ